MADPGLGGQMLSRNVGDFMNVDLRMCLCECCIAANKIIF